MVAASAGGRTVDVGRRWAAAGGAVAGVTAALAPPLVLLLFTALLFSAELTGGPIAYGRDTATFYYPLTEWAVGELRGGRLPLWTPLIFGGYPLLADGEVGPLYPLNLLLFLSLPFPIAYGAMRAVHFFIAAAGAYALARTIGAGRLGALIGGLTFGYGSFMVGHLQHDNILRSTAWLPWLLLMIERALRSRGGPRARWALGGAILFAMMCLGIHIQPILLALLLAGAWLLAGPLVGEEPGADAPSRSPGSWLLSRVRIGLVVFGIGGALAAAQLVPLYFLGMRSLRPGQVSYDFATSYAVSPAQLATFVFPFMFNFDTERNWALWPPHESTLYVGVGPLILALIGICFVRTRAVLFLAVVALISLTLAFGDYLPIKPYSMIWSLPGFGYLRAPARFALLLQVALACLAAIGFTWVERRAAGRAAPRALRAILVGILVGAGGLAIGLAGLRWWLRDSPGPVLEAFRSVYLQTSKENWLLGPWHVYYGLQELARPTNPWTLLGLGLLIATPGLLLAWLRRPELGPLWRACLLWLVLADLWLFAAVFYPRREPSQLWPATPALGHLPAGAHPGRLFVEPALNQQLGPNLLVPRGIQTVGGYSSLEPSRFSDYWWSLVGQDNFLLDIFNARHVIASRRPTGQRTWAGTVYHPTDRLLSGAAGNPGGAEQFRVPPTLVAGLTVISAVEGMGEALPDAPVAEIALTDAKGDTRTLVARAGRDTAEHLAPEPGRPTAEYQGPLVVWAGSSFVPNGNGQPVRLYGATLAVDPPIEAIHIVVRTAIAPGRLHLHGLGLRTASGAVSSVRATDKAKYRLLYEDATLAVLENTAAWPRVFVVEGARSVEPNRSVVEQLLTTRWDPTREIMVEGVGPAAERAAAAAEPIGSAELVAFEPARVVARAELSVPGYLVLADRFDVGWRAWVDDREATILRANSVSRAVAVPAGSHTVTFVYDPWWLTVGFAISGLAGAGVMAGFLVSAFRWRRSE